MQSESDDLTGHLATEDATNLLRLTTISLFAAVRAHFIHSRYAINCVCVCV